MDKPPMNQKDDERVRTHYLLEKSLAQRILASSREERTQTVIDAYNTLFSEIPWHSQFQEVNETKKIAEKRMHFEHLINQDVVDTLDIGAGSAYWVRYLAKNYSGRCVGIDISKEILRRKPDDPPNLELYIMNAVDLKFPPGSFDLVLSSQMIEHIHPDDIQDHCASVYKVLKQDGVYAFDTPSRLDGPHDISRHFDEVATGFHLKEWTYRELSHCLRKVGFRKIRSMVLPWRMVKRFSRLFKLGRFPVSLLLPGERMAEKINHKKVRVAFCKVFRVVPIYITAQK